MKPASPVLLALSLLPACPAAENPQAIIHRMEAVADYQIAHPATEKTDGWVQGAFYVGLTALDEVSTSRRFDRALMAVGEENEWGLNTFTERPPSIGIYHSDDMVVGQAYLYLYERHRDPKMLAAMRQRCDAILAHPMDDRLAFVGPAKNNRWSWCDALFMGPPGWMHLAKITGRRAYRDYTVDHWWKTADYLYDPAEHLYFRDSTYFQKREKNGRKVFWSRGNGWVVAGLAHVLDFLPPGDPARPRFEAQFKQMANRVLQLQSPGGSWAASLLDPEGCQPAMESSGTGFFCYGFAWGVDHGLLDAGTFGPAAWRAWASLQRCVEPSGRLNHVQPIGAAPSTFPADSTVPYGPGAFLLAGSELSRMAGR